jgi:hypothetical protein
MPVLRVRLLSAWHGNANTTHRKESVFDFKVLPEVFLAGADFIVVA